MADPMVEKQFDPVFALASFIQIKNRAPTSLGLILLFYRRRQGDQIRRIFRREFFAFWAIVFFGRLFSLGDCILWAIVFFGQF
jgi:hypothetical protein